MRKLFLMAVLLIAGMGMGFGQESKGIDFETGSTLDQALAKAKAEGKYVFLDVYATWCRPCKKMEASVFPDQTLGEYINARFVSIKINGESEAGRRIDRKYDFRGYPTIFILDSKGKKVGEILGGRSAGKLLQDVKKIMKSELQ